MPIVQLKLAPDGVLVRAMFVVSPLQMAAGDTGFTVGVGFTVTVALSLPVIGHESESLPDCRLYVVSPDGLTLKLKVGPAPVWVPPPLLSVTLYGPVPPLTVTVTVAFPPAQIVPPPVTVPVMVGQTFVSEKFTAVAPFALAATVYGPPTVALAVTVPDVPVPLAIVAGLPAIVALAPLPGGVNVTSPPLTGSLKALVTVTLKGLVNAVLIFALWLSPLAIARVKPCDSKAPMSTVVCCGRVIPR